MFSLKNSLLMVACVCLCADLSVAQTSTTTLSGTVYDPSGAVVGGAEVTATNDATGVSFKQVTNEAGLYSFPSIGVGMYSVTVEIPGFKTARATGITLNVGTPAIQNITLELGAAAETVSVEAATIPVNTSNATLGNIVERAAVVTLPLNGRNPLNLIVLEPGVVQTGSTGVNVNGMRGQSGNVTIDGIEANEASNPTPVNNVFRINPDNVQEFKVTTSNPTAEEGRNAGLNVSIATRSGGNEFHLEAVEYFRNTVLNANESFANAQDNPRTNIKSNQYGLDFSGPIKKNKTFVYGAWQGQKVNLQLAIDKAFGNIPTLYTPQAMAGVFRYFVADPANPFFINGQRITANSPLLVKADGSLADGVRNCTSAADRNCIQSYNMYANDPQGIGGDAQVLKLLNSYPQPNNYGAGDGLNTAGYLWNTPYQVRGPRNLLRFDHNFNSNNSVFFRVMWAEEQQLKGDPLNSRPAIYPGFPPRGEVERPAQNWALSFRTVISPTQVNELTLGFARFKFNFTYIDSNPDGANLPRFTFNNATEHYVNQPHSIRWLNTPQIIDNFSWVKGSHQLKFGANVRFYQQNNQNSSGQNNTVPQISLSSTINPPGSGFNLPSVASGSNAGIASADNARLLSTINDLLGIPAQLRATFLANLNTDTFISSKTSDYYSVWATGERLKQFNAFAQDEWRARRNLTVNYGVRWEFNRPPTESSQPVFVPDKPVNGSQGRVSFVRANSWWERSNLTAFAPRLSFTWTPLGEKTVIRAGYGISFDPVATFFATAAANSVPGIAFSCIAQNNSTTQGCDSVPRDTRLSRGFPTELPPPNIKPSTFLSPPPQVFGVAPNIAVVDPNLQQSTIHQWNLSIQREIPGDMVLQVAYVGNRGTRLYSNLDANQVSAAPIVPQFLMMQSNLRNGCNPDGTGCPSGVTGQSIPLVTSGIVTAAFVNSSATRTDLGQNAAGNFAGRIEQTTMAAGLRPNQQFSTAVFLSNAADSNYHSMQTTLRKRFADGLLFNLSYTFSKVIDNQSSDPVGTSGTPTVGATTVGGVVDSNNLRRNRGPANWDRTHVWVTTWIYELPFGRGKKWMGNTSSLLNALLGGWSIQGFNAVMSGSPFSVMSGSRTAFFGSGTGTNGISRAALVGNTQPDAKLKNKPGVVGPVFFEDASAFTFAAPGDLGMGRNTFRGPSYWDVDASVSKTFRFRERTNITFRLEAFNALNHTNYRSLSDATTGDNRINNPAFGQSCCQSRPTATSTAIVSNGEAYRVVQAVLKLAF
jgi:Carboxypeptidase regulatory-like domain